jgi:hypothetical protein
MLDSRALLLMKLSLTQLGDKVGLCAGFRMPAMDDGATCTVAGVRKSPRNEPAGDGAQGVPRTWLWGFG